MSASVAEIARLFNADGNLKSNAGELIYPGYPGLVVADGAVRSMTWGFPLVLKSKRTGEPLKPKPVNNARTDKLDGYFWRSSFEARRCLIPVSAFAEAEGAKGAKTRTWFSAADTVSDGSLFACAGIWRDSDEFGACYSMVMTDANATVEPVHNRMPVILRDIDWAAWTDGSTETARELCTSYKGELTVDRTDDPWTR